jgi:single-stranded DNA-binding protein
MAHRNELFITGRIVSSPTLGKMPSGTPLLWFTLESEEAFVDKARRDACHTNTFRVEMLGANVSLHADHIKIGRECYIRGYIRNDNGLVKVRVRHFEMEKTYYEGFTRALDLAIACLKDSGAANSGTATSSVAGDASRVLEQLLLVRESCDPKKDNSAQSW